MYNLGCLTIYIIAIMLLVIPLLLAHLITGAFMILGFTPNQALLLLILSLVGGLINIPIKKWPEFYIPPQKPSNILMPQLQKLFVPKHKVLAINIGGAIIPGLVSIWEIYRIITEFSDQYPMAILVFLFVFILNILVCYRTAKPVEGMGIVIPAFIPPLIVSVPSILLLPDIAPVIAFPAGVLGVLIGADLFHLKSIEHLNAPIGSIGGAGTFDGIFLCGVLSVFLTG